MKYNNKLTTLPSIAFSLSFCLSASVVASDSVSINGFLSAGGGWYNGETDESVYNGYDEDFQADPVTRLGVQLSAEVSDKVTATGQLIARGQDDYDVEAEWAYVSYAVNESWDVRAGRLRLPFYLYSDFLDVGYAYPWITPPSEVYTVSFSTLEGADTIYRTSFGDWDSTIQVYYGRLTDETTLGDAPGEFALDLTDLWGVNISLNRDWLTLRAAVNFLDYTVESPPALDPLYDGLTQAGFADVADAIRMEDESARYFAFSASADYNDWLAIAELTIADIDEQNLISDWEAWYLTLGRRINEFTFHVTYMTTKADPDYSILNSIPDGVDPGLDALKAGARSAIINTDNEGIILGIRYDFAPATALKVEVTQLEFNEINEDGTLVNFSVDTVF